MDFDGKAVAVGLRKHLYVHSGKQENTDSKCHEEYENHCLGEAEAKVQQFFKRILQQVEELVLRSFECVHIVVLLPYEFGTQVWSNPHGIEQRNKQCERDCPREEFHEVAKRSVDNLGHREEHCADGYGGEQGGNEQFLCAYRCREPPRMPLLLIVGVAVNYND